MSEESTLDEFAQAEHSKERKETPIGELPADWDVEWLNNVVTINSDGFLEDDWPSDTFEYISLSEASNGEILGSKTTQIDEAPSRAQRTVQQGDVLIGTVRPKQKSHGLVTEEHDGKICSSGFGVLRTGPNINSRYLIQEVLSNRFFSQMEAYVAGSGYPAVKLSDLKKHRVSIPPLSEQRKIATVLYTVDQAIEKTEDILDRLETTSSKVAQKLAISGIGHSEFEKVRLGPKQIEVPTEWGMSKFGDLSNVQQGLQIAKSERYREDTEGRYQYITVQYLNDPQDPANNWFIEDPRKTVICEKEDVLMTRTGNTGEVITGVEGAFHNNFFKIEFDRELLLRDYLVHYLESKTIQDILISYAGTTTIPDLNHGEFFNIPVLLPPIDEQREISKIIASMNNKVAQEDRYLNSLQRLKRGLMQDLLSGTVRTTDTNITVPDEVAQHG